MSSPTPTLVSPARWLEEWMGNATTGDLQSHTDKTAELAHMNLPHIHSHVQAQYFAALACVRWPNNVALASMIALGVVAGPDLKPVDINGAAYIERLNLDVTTLVVKRPLIDAEPAGRA